MKRVLLIATALFFATPNIKAQDKDEEVKTVLVSDDNATNYYYEGIVPVEGVTKEEMFKRAKQWVLSTFKTEDNSAGFDEKEFIIFNSPTIVLEKFKSAPGDYVNFKIKLSFKDGKYKFRFDNLMVKSNNFPIDPPVAYNGTKMFPGRGAKYNSSVIEKVNKSLLALSIDLENNIKGGAKKDDW
ncbi:DUF4468 domain-containing protein [Taibaiella lutea]|uniref:DUF4468 domain-containing protein n=1 Tax=Taibaiella lutea TaxID=2608001 RepID=A0A5M6CNQ6_9BACT|nr:DUF4468 domain-containing protein [Taibaiella lutea]KAA5536707.1 DUF4468 domain-containing protein [Taibaiella lutea]